MSMTDTQAVIATGADTVKSTGSILVDSNGYVTVAPVGGRAALYGVTPTVRQAHITDPATTSSAIVDATGGTPSGTHTLVAPAGASYSTAELKNNFATIATEYNALRVDALAIRTALNAVLVRLEVLGIILTA